MVHVKRMREEEWDHLEKWKMRFLDELDSFQEDGIEVEAFRLDEWVGDD